MMSAMESPPAEAADEASARSSHATRQLRNALARCQEADHPRQRRRRLWVDFKDFVCSQPDFCSFYGSSSVEPLRGAPESELRCVLEEFLEHQEQSPSPAHDEQGGASGSTCAPSSPSSKHGKEEPVTRSGPILRAALLAELLSWSREVAGSWPPGSDTLPLELSGQGSQDVSPEGQPRMQRGRPSGPLRSFSILPVDDDLLSRPEFWKKVVRPSEVPSPKSPLSGRLRRSSRSRLPEMVSDRTELQYDLTPKRVEADFKKLLKQAMKKRKEQGVEGPKERLTLKELKTAFDTLAGEERFKAIQSDATRDELLSKLEDIDRKATVGSAELHFYLRQLTMAMMLRDEVLRDLPHCMSVAKYDHDHCDAFIDFPDGSGSQPRLEEFLFSGNQHKEEETCHHGDEEDEDHECVNWVHIEATSQARCRDDKFALLTCSLATKYGLHPLVVEDIISTETPTKIDAHELGAKKYYHVSIEAVTLCSAATTYLEACEDEDSSVGEMKPPPVHVHRSQITILVDGPPKHGTIITIHRACDVKDNRLQRWWGHGGHDAKDDDGEDMLGRLFGGPRGLWEELRAHPPRRVREHRGDFLLYEVLDRVVKQLLPITTAYNARLGFFHKQIKEDPEGFNKTWLSEISDARLELEDIKGSIRPLCTVVTSIIRDDEISKEATTFLEDVEDHLQQVTLDLDQLASACTDLVETYSRHSDQRTNDVLMALTVMSASVMPMQLLSGVYGMNFVTEDGSPGLPELRWRYGYAFYWSVSLTLSITTVLLVMASLGKLRNYSLRQRCLAAVGSATSWQSDLLPVTYQNRLRATFFNLSC
eukprot:TRINITY_DN76023_c0_g1_i1.p1 TRINITY_DN76023_c0_g1~~TRINITY_DN76023_c0_g1_i1.p1  ORF type:complete len:819 (-),score=186.28 TRINITY_DN76023_c0_g1_i1:26-2482(-)